MKRVLFFITIFFLSACTEYKWVKEGKSDFEMNKEFTACHAKALTDLPPHNMVFNSNSSVSSHEGKQKKRKKNHDYDDYNKLTRNDINDANSQQREVLIRDCMFSRGWNELIINI